MLLLEEYISNFTCARYYFLYVEFSGFYVNQSLAGQTLVVRCIRKRRKKSVLSFKKNGDDLIAQKWMTS
jgi:hypothetical protein